MSNGWIFGIDESIGHSGEKILAVLGIRSDHYALNQHHPGFADLRCMGVAVSSSWTGEKIATFLKKILEITGKPSAYIKDGGGNLAKACKILAQDGCGSPEIADISNISANLLKEVYGEHPDLDGFLSACGQAATRLKQTVLSCLTPPKVRSKTRFMNLHRLVRWAKNFLDLSPQGRAPDQSILQKLRDSIDMLPRFRLFIENFLRDATRTLWQYQLRGSAKSMHDAT